MSDDGPTRKIWDDVDFFAFGWMWAFESEHKGWMDDGDEGNRYGYEGVWKGIPSRGGRVGDESEPCR